MKKIWLFFLLIACNGPQSFDEKNRIPPLNNVHTFAVLPVIFALGLDGHSVETQLVTALEKIGTVSFSEISEIPSSIVIMLGKVAGQSSKAQAQYFPVFWASLEVSSAAEVLENHSIFPCTVWRKDAFFEEEETVEATSAKAINVLQAMIDEFAVEYYKANKDMIRPHFDIASEVLQQKENLVK